ncbi:CRTAM protein, partial [Urocynchramus pylzowi]|nr:CRTAM protein [Urocynchramus pylzowi]
TLQWLNPRGFTVFLNAQQVLRDQRYKLLHYSQDELSIQLSNLTVQDEGIYKCFYYSRRVKNKSQNVEILAAPSYPVLEVSQDEGRGIKLSCYTQGGRPQPQISWLLDNGIELPGETRHQLGADGKKWSTRSTLRILSYSPRVTASCILQHPALGPRSLGTSFHFQDLPSTEDAEVPSSSENPAVSNSPENPAGTSPSASPENPEHQPQSSQTSQMSHLTVKQNPKSKGVLKKEKSLLLPILVAALILVLLIIVLLFMVKLKKAHGVWRR